MALRPHKEIVAIHEKDPGWIIALWLAIHGGDPAPEGVISAETAARVAAEAIKSLATRLDPPRHQAVTGALGH